ncbi:flagellar basal body-associated FliL family protein [Comamonas composti]|uniref:flagellar basal body-associated FliL family protein n=1 Tax=Comamonas composti TaxID=408558 RepID=UPI00047E1F63|nr:flagellar basal body-associated FliL family protein [Comamonas composti]
MNSDATSSPAPAPARGKKLIIAVIVLILLLAAGAYALLLMRHGGSDDEEGGRAAAAVLPTFLPLESLVVNLADPGGDRFVQIGITLELADEKTASLVKQYLPSIRNGILIQVSQRTADELLTREGKERLAADVQAEVAAPLGYGPLRKKRAQDGDEDEGEQGSRKKAAANPVRRVLFSSFIVQ